MKPKPFSALNHFTVPCVILFTSFFILNERNSIHPCGEAYHPWLSRRDKLLRLIQTSLAASARAGPVPHRHVAGRVAVADLGGVGDDALVVEEDLRPVAP